MIRAGILRAVSRAPRAILCGTVILVALTSAARAQALGPNYNFVEGGVLWIDPDDLGSDIGWFAGGSFGTRSFHAFGEFADPGDPATWFIGAGWHGLLGQKADLVAQGAFVDADVADGFRIQAGFRWMVVSRVELNGFLTHTDLDLTDTNGVSVGAIWDFTLRAGVGGSYEFGDEGDQARAFVRFNFGPR